MNTQEIMQMTEQYVMNTYRRLPVAFVKGQGCYLWDAEGKKYLDFLSGIAVTNLGHAHPRITEVINQQAGRLLHTSNLFYIHSQAELAQMLCENSFADKVFFCNSGAEANEAAVKLARRYGKIHHGEHCFEIITAEKSFHGRTLKMMAATGQAKIKKGFEPLPEGFYHIPYDDLSALEQAITPNTCAVMLEPIQGEGGIRQPSPGYMKAVKKICQEKNILLIFDEIQTGMGRTGQAFAYEHEGVTPDILTLAKALGAGLPIGACLAREEVASSFQPGDHATTFGGGFLVCEAAKAFLEILFSADFLNEVQEVSELLISRLQGLKSKFSFINEIRGQGMLIGMDLNQAGQAMVELALGKGLIINCVQEKTLRLAPPLILKKKQVDEAVVILEEVFKEY